MAAFERRAQRRRSTMVEEPTATLSTPEDSVHGDTAPQPKRSPNMRLVSSDGLHLAPSAVTASRRSFNESTSSQMDGLSNSAGARALSHLSSSIIGPKDLVGLKPSQSMGIAIVLNNSDALHRGMHAKIASSRRRSSVSMQMLSTGESNAFATSASADEISPPPKFRPSQAVRARLRHLWRVAAVGCMMAYRLIQLDRRLVPKLVTYSIETNIDSDALVMLIRNYVPKRDMSLSARVREYFASERTDAQTEKMAQLLSFRLHSFGSYSPHQQRQLCQMMQYEIHPQGRLVVKEGHRPYAVYFILSGQLDVFTVTDNIKYRLNICKTGDSFGDRSFKIENDGVRELCPRRTASVSTMLETELLQVNREDYIRILMISTKAQQQENINRLLSLPHFCDDRSIVERIVAHAKFHRFEPHQVIVSEGSVPLSMFWILSGTCRCDKMMRVVRRKTTKGKEIVKLFVASQAAQAETDDKTSYELMTLFEFQPGDFFPAMPPALTTMVQEDDSCRLKYVFQLSEQEETGKGSPSHYTVISSSQVDVMSISHHDFAMFASCKMVCQALDDIRFKITADEIVAAFEQRSRWKEFRKEQIQQSRK